MISNVTWWSFQGCVDRHNQSMMAPKDPQNVLDSKLWILQVPRSIDWTCFGCVVVTMTRPRPLDALFAGKVLVFSSLFSLHIIHHSVKTSHFDSRTEVMTVSYVKIICGMFSFYEGNSFFPRLTIINSAFRSADRFSTVAKWPSKRPMIAHTPRLSHFFSLARTIMWKSAHKKILIHRLLSSPSSLSRPVPVVWCAYQL